jgi:hypothetical protein
MLNTIVYGTVLVGSIVYETALIPYYEITKIFIRSKYTTMNFMKFYNSK